MASDKIRTTDSPIIPRREVPPGATRKAFDREDNGGGPRGSPLGDRHAAGTPAGGGELGGLGGSNVGDGEPIDDPTEVEGVPDDAPPYAGHAGGAVGGTPAEDRASGGNVHHGYDPGAAHRGDSTIGADPDKG